jgi:hypothetical protein
MCEYTVNVVWFFSWGLALVAAEAIPAPPAATAITVAAPIPSAHVFLMSVPLWPASGVGDGQEETLMRRGGTAEVPFGYNWSRWS